MPRSAFLPLILFLFLFPAAPAFSWTMGDAAEAYAKREYRAAYPRYRYLAERGDPTAQFWLAVMLENGQGTASDPAEAARWYRRAADQGHAAAQSQLGFLYFRGIGVPKDPETAYMWITLAVSQFPGPGPERDLLAGNRDAAAAVLTPAQIAAAQRRAREWKPKKETPGTPTPGSGK